MASLAADVPATLPPPAVPRAAALYLAGVQFLFASMWIIYVLFLPGLLEGVGISRDYVVWILLFDQVLFIVMDVAVGIFADRVIRIYGRVAGPIVAITAVSCVAFLLIPYVVDVGGRGPAGQALLFVLVFIWSATSSALRAPPWVMLGKYAATPSVPWLAALALVGLAVAGAISPYLGVTLRNLDPRLPFALSSLTLLAVTAGLLWVERALARAGGGAAPAGPGAACSRPG